MCRIAIIEDNPMHSDRLSQCLTKYGEENKVSFSVSIFSNGAAFLEEFLPNWDVLFIDIEMPYVDGITLAKKVREKDASVIIIFVTNLAQFAIKGYAVQALDYLLKPLNYAAFSITMSKVTALLARRERRSISLQNKDGIFRIDLSDLYYVEVQRHNLIYHTSDRAITVRGTLSLAAKELGEDFARCNHCYLINLAFVTHLGREAVQVGDYSLSVSRRMYLSFFNSFSAYLERTLL